MPTYVYAIHPFSAQNEDELTFDVGDKIEVTAKDDGFSDGWWTGRIIIRAPRTVDREKGGPVDEPGEIGLFPVAYTSPDRPPMPAPSTETSSVTNGTSTTNEESPTDEPPIEITTVPPDPNDDAPPSRTLLSPLPIALQTIDASVPLPTPPPSLPAVAPELHPILTEVTDVQQAIRQLTHRASNPSISFASSHNSEVDHESDARSITTTETSDDEEKARRAVEEAEKLESMLLSEHGIELSDESDDEDDDGGDDGDDEDDTHQRQLGFERIVEETEEEDNSNNGNGNNVSVPLRNGDVAEEALRTATLASKFPEPAPEPEPEPELRVQQPTKLEATARPTSAPPPAPVPPQVPKSPPPPPPPPPLPAETSNAIPKEEDTPAESHEMEPDPSLWSIPQVISWLKSKGFGADVCERFEVHEVTGDVLLSMNNTDLLKDEIGIPAFGKRMRISNAIGELKMRASGLDLDLDGGLEGGADWVNHQRQHHQHHQYNQYGQYNQQQGQQQQRGLDSPPATRTHHNSLSHSISQSLSDKRLTSSSFGGGERGILSEPETSRPRNGSAGGVGTPPPPNANANTPPNPNPSTPSSTHKKRFFSGSIDSSHSRESKRSSSSGYPNLNSPGLPVVESPLFYVSEEKDGDGDEVENGEGEKEPTSAPIIVMDSSKLTGIGARPSKKSSSSTSPSSPTTSSAPAPAPAPSKPERLSIFGATFGVVGGGNKNKNKTRKPVPRYSGVLSDDTQLLDYQQRPSLSHRGEGKGSGSGFHLPRLGKRPGTSDGLGGRGGEVGLLRKKSSVQVSPTSVRASQVPGGESAQKDKEKEKEKEKGILDLSNPDYSGFVRKKGERYNTWKMRYLVLKGVELWILKSEKWGPDTKPKGYINLLNYRVSTLSPGSPTVGPANEYLFVLTPTASSTTSTPLQNKLHYFSSPSLSDTRAWLKALVKPTISRDYTKPVISSANVPTIPLVVAQAMNPAPRPPSPSGVGRVQRAFRKRRETELAVGAKGANGSTPVGEEGVDGNGPGGVGRLSSRDARVLMGLEVGTSPVEPSLPSPTTQENESTTTHSGAHARNSLEEFGAILAAGSSPTSPSQSSSRTPPRPSSRRVSGAAPIDPALLTWANTHLNESIQIPVPLPPLSPLPQTLTSGLCLLRIAEDIKGSPCSPPVPDSVFDTSNPTNSDNLTGLFRLFDFLLDNDVKMGSISINDIRMGRREKVGQVLRALKQWEERRRLLMDSISRGGGGIGGVGGFVAPVMGMGGLGLGGSMY